MSENHQTPEQPQLSTIGRAVDPDYPTNRLILILTAVGAAAGLSWGLFTGWSVIEAALLGVRSGLALFLSWALTRELDPDREWAAFAAVGFTGLGLLILGAPDLGVVFWALLLLRVVNHTTGLSATLLDTLGLVGLGVWLSWQGNWGLGFVTSLSLWVDAYLQDGKRRQAVLGGVSLLAAGAAYFLGGRVTPLPGFAWGPAALAGGLAALYGPVIAAAREVESACDQTGKRMLPRRIQAGQLFGLLIGLELALWHGWQGIAAVLPLWGAAAGSLAYRFSLVVFESRGKCRDR